MITDIELRQFIETFIKNTNTINIDTLDQYLAKYNFADTFHNCNINKIKGDIFENIAKQYYQSRMGKP